VNITEGHVIIQ